MRFRQLRIGLSAVCGVLCLLLTALWVRSYWRFDQFVERVSAARYFAYTSFQGQFAFGGSDDPALQRVFPRRWTLRTFRTNQWDEALDGPLEFFPASQRPDDGVVIHWPRFSSMPLGGLGSYSETLIPYWLLCLLFATCAALPWLLGWRALKGSTTSNAAA